MGALVWVMLFQLAALIVFVLGLVAVILGLTAVSKESDKKRESYLPYIVYSMFIPSWVYSTIL